MATATLRDMVQGVGRTNRRTDTVNAKNSAAAAGTTPVLKANPKRISWTIANGGANAGRITRRAGVASDTLGIPLAATDGVVGESWDVVGEAVQDAVYVKMATGDQDVYVEEIELA